eukprot:8801657-Pyramimonas_sp.AAC.1
MIACTTEPIHFLPPRENLVKSLVEHLDVLVPGRYAIVLCGSVQVQPFSVGTGLHSRPRCSETQTNIRSSLAVLAWH